MTEMRFLHRNEPFLVTFIFCFLIISPPLWSLLPELSLLEQSASILGSGTEKFKLILRAGTDERLAHRFPTVTFPALVLISAQCEIPLQKAEVAKIPKQRSTLPLVVQATEMAGWLRIPRRATSRIQK